jgi:hypothetical protein
MAGVKPSRPAHQVRPDASPPVIRVANVVIRTVKATNRRAPTAEPNRAATRFVLAQRTARTIIITDAWIGRSASGAFRTAGVYRSTEVIAGASEARSAAC